VWCLAEQGEPGYWAAKWKSTENPTMSKAFIEAKSATMSPEMFEQEYEAGIVTFQGAIYGANMVEPLVIDDRRRQGFELLKRYIPEWPNRPCAHMSCGVGSGFRPSVRGTLAIITEHAIIVIGEYLMREKPAIIHAANFRAMVGNLQPRWGVDRSQPQSIIELAQHGIFAQSVEAGPGSVVAGIERVKSWMVTGRMRFVKTRTKQTVAQLKTYRWKKNEKNDGSTAKQEPYKKKDDLCDAVSYIVRMWPHLPEAPEVEQGVRDLTKLGDTERRDIERVMHHMEQVRRDKIEDGVGEFYDTVVDGHGGAFDEFYA
jgi:hypothetical protein